MPNAHSSCHLFPRDWETGGCPSLASLQVHTHARGTDRKNHVGQAVLATGRARPSLVSALLLYAIGRTSISQRGLHDSEAANNNIVRDFCTPCLTKSKSSPVCGTRSSVQVLDLFVCFMTMSSVRSPTRPRQCAPFDSPNHAWNLHNLGQEFSLGLFRENCVQMWLSRTFILQVGGVGESRRKEEGTVFLAELRNSRGEDVLLETIARIPSKMSHVLSTNAAKMYSSTVLNTISQCR